MTATIEAHGLEKRYRKTRALDGLDLVAESGQVTAVLGPNGARLRWTPWSTLLPSRPSSGGYSVMPG